MNRMHFRPLAAAFPIVLALATGCEATAPPPPPVAPVAYVAPPVVVAEPEPAPPPVQAPTMLRVASDILSACGIKDSPSGKSPRFAFDSATLSSEDEQLLGAVATCFTAGPLAGRTLLLTGRADRRGTEAYNQSLGDRRANSVGGYLREHGMSAGKLTETSRGARDATGNEEYGWMLDRRVDVDLVNETVASIP